MKFNFYITLIFLFSIPLFSIAQKKDNATVAAMIKEYQETDRGPYLDIRWFCDDGTFSMPKVPCEDTTGVQRARYKPEVIDLAETNHIFLGQILSTTSRTDFWDEENAQSRLKQYALGKFLAATDDGWVNRKGQYYRGAFQAEDETEWGIDFFELILNNRKRLNQHFYLLRQAVKDIPHAGDTDLTQNVRALSKIIAESYPPFMDLRIKIHGQPSADDVPAVKAFREKHRSEMTEEDLQKYEVMIRDMEKIYQPTQLTALEKYTKKVSSRSAIRKEIEQYISNFKDVDFSVEKSKATCDILYAIRNQIDEVRGGEDRLALMDISLALENLLFKEMTKWQPSNYKETMEQIYFLGKASTGCGYLEVWEWEEIKPQITVPKKDSLNIVQLMKWHESARRLVEWGTGMPRAVYQKTINLYGGFEPQAYGFLDDKIRSSLVLLLGNAVSELGNAVAAEANFSNQILNLDGASSFRGLNPGIALGELVVVSGSPDEVEVSKDKIYIFQSPPSDLKPVAGIVTVSEGNMVSHVQLLARNLGIPNAVLSAGNLEDLKKYDGEKVFYAVSNQGTVLMKLEDDMNEMERKLFEVKKRNEEKVRVPVDNIRLDLNEILSLRAIKSKDSGKLSGPKAANLGQLKAMFPDEVVEGLVIPFGIFRNHLDQQMVGKNVSYWAFLNQTFADASKIKDEDDAEKFMLGELETFRNAILKIPLKDEFVKDLKDDFRKVLGGRLGRVPVFLRSDTNMEDLKDFTGAGLNLTLFNVLDDDEILQGIRRVWASPYTERSYKWRQKYLLNPENVFPSILIIPSVDVEYSGVVITKGITSGNDDDITVAFSRGAGGAVDGQAAESYLLAADGKNILLSPAREPGYLRLPKSGGTTRNNATFERRILNKKNIKDLRNLNSEVNRILPTTAGVESKGPFDIELGFEDDKMWLFQIRPFVENKNAKSSDYLESISPKISKTQIIGMADKLAVPKEQPVISPTDAVEKSSNLWMYIVGGLVAASLIIGVIVYQKNNQKSNEL